MNYTTNDIFVNQTRHAPENELTKIFPYWCTWRYEQRPGQSKPSKVPINPLTGGRLSVDNPRGWVSYSEVEDLEHKGFLLLKGIGYTGVDWDECLDPETLEIDPAILPHIKILRSYTYLTPSGKGLRTILYGNKPENSRCRFEIYAIKIEVYDDKRFFTYDDNFLVLKTVLPLNTIRSPILDDDTNLLEENIPLKSSRKSSKKSSSDRPKKDFAGGELRDSDRETVKNLLSNLSDEERTKVKKLLDGDIKGYPSQSEADQALCWYLAKATYDEATDTHDEDAINRIFSHSGLYRDKWDREEYKSYTIDVATQAQRESYDPDPRGSIKRKLEGMYCNAFRMRWSKPEDLLIYLHLL